MPPRDQDDLARDIHDVYDALGLSANVWPFEDRPNFVANERREVPFQIVLTHNSLPQKFPR